MGVGEESAEVGHGFCDAGGTGELGEGRVRVSIRTEDQRQGETSASASAFDRDAGRAGRGDLRAGT